MRRPLSSALAMVLAVVAVTSVAMAGKPERDRQAELTPKAAALKADLKSRCGCDITVTVNYDSYKTADDMFRVEAAFSSLTEATAACSSATEKPIICKHLKGYTVAFSANPVAAESGGTITCGSNANSHCGTPAISRIVDAWN